VDTYLITGGGTTYEFTGLPRYNAAGEEYIYVVDESDVAGYDKAQNGRNFTNTYNPSKASADVKARKDVTGAGAPDETFTFTLTANEATHPMPSGSTAGVKSVQFKKGAVDFGPIEYSLPGTYVYTVAEVKGTTEGFGNYDATAYTMTVKVEDANGVLSVVSQTYAIAGVDQAGMVFTNGYTVPQRKLTVTLNWADTADALGGRPANATVQLYRTPEGGAKEAVGAAVQMTGSGAVWTREFTNLAAHDGQGKVYTYAVEQAAVPNYAVTYNTGGADIAAWAEGESRDLSLSILDTLETVSVSGQKVWRIIGNAFTVPDSIEVYLFRNGATPAYRTIQVLPGSNPTVWNFTFDNLLAYDQAGAEYVYTVKEKTDIFAVESTVNGMTITNTYGADETVKIRIEWDHTGAPDADKPSSVTANIHRNGSAAVYESQAVDATMYWAHIFEVPLVDFTGAGFSITQNSLLPRYTTAYSVDGSDGTLVAKNTYVMPLKDVEVTIDWIDDSDALTLRPADTVIRLYRTVAGGTADAVQGCALSVSGTGNGWTHTFSDLPTYDAQGRLYTYTVGQEGLDVHYSESVTGLAITNSLMSGGVEVKKSSSPAANKAGEVPALAKGEVITYTITVTNTGQRKVYDTQVRDVIPAELTVGVCSPAPKSNTLNGDGSRTLIWEIGELGKGEVYTITLPATVSDVFESFSNVAYYTLKGEPEEEIIEPVVTQRITLTKSADPAAGAQVVEGQAVTYTLKLGAKYATSGIVVADVIPAGMTFVPGSLTTTGAANGTYNGATRTVSWPDQAIGAGETTMTFQATVDKFSGAYSKIIANQATATMLRESGSSVEVSNEIEHEAVRRQVTVTKDAALVDEQGVAGSYERGTLAAPIETELGQTVRYRLTLESQGYLTQGAVTVEDVLHPDVRFVAGSFEVNPASLAGKVVLTQAPSAGNGNKAIWTVNGLGKDEGLAIEFEVTAPVGTDDPSTEIYETRKVFANGASLTDEGLKNLSGQGGAPVYTNAGEYTASSNSTYNVVFESELAGRKYGTPSSPKGNGDIVVVEAGDIISYTIEVMNVGEKDADKARVLDILPEGVELVAVVKGPAPLVFEEAGVTTLMWELPNLAHADRATGQPVAGGIIELEFTVRVLEPGQARVMENAAYYRLSGAGEPFPTVSGRPDETATYRKTGTRVQHQTYMFGVEMTVAGGQTAVTAARVEPGEQVSFAAILDAASGISGVNTQYAVPEGMSPATGSLRMVLPNGTVVPVADSAYNPVTGMIAWPQTGVTAGETRFEAIMIVEPLRGNELEKLYASAGSVSLADGNGGVKSATGQTLYHEASVGFSQIAKTAALVENGAALGQDAGTAQAPVRGERGQEVEYTLRITRDAGAKNRSGRIVVTDALPQGMALVAGSIQGTVSGAGSVVSMGAGQAGVEWVLEGLADDSVATLVFRASLPESADDPQTAAVETRREVLNTARLVDEAIGSMKYARALPGKAAGSNVYEADAYDKTSNATYHYILGPSVAVVKSASVPEGGRVKGGDLVTYTITVRNTGEDAVTNLLVRDRLNEALRYREGTQSSSRADAQFVQNGQLIGWIVPDLAIGETVVLTFRARVEDMETGSRVIPNVAHAGESKFGANPATELRTAAYLRASNQIELVQIVGSKLIVRKVDAATGAALSGAEFVVRQVSATAAYNEIQDMTAISNRAGEAIFDDLPPGMYVVIEKQAPEGYIASPVWRSIDTRGGRAERSIIVPNRRDSGISSQTDFGDEEELRRNWGALLEIILDVGVPNAGAGSRNVGDCPK